VSTSRWAICLPLADASAASALRLRERVEVCQVGDQLWLRGNDQWDDLDRTLRMVAGARRFDVDAEGALTPVGRRLPCGQLPEGSWEPIGRWLVPDFAIRPNPDAHAPRATVLLVRGGTPAEPSLLLTDVESWINYALTAPAVRLAELAFAAGGDRRAAIRGQPLPPVRGQFYYDRTGVHVPSGYVWSPDLPGRILRELCGADTESEDVVVFHLDGSCEIISGRDFVPAARASARLTRARF
jgi:hypothetical protein